MSAATSAPLVSGFFFSFGCASSLSRCDSHLPANRSSWLMNGRAQVLRHLLDEDVVLREVAARRVEHRRVVGDALGDDAVAGLGHDRLGRADEILVAHAGVVHRLFVDADERAFPLGERRVLARAAQRHVGRRDHRVFLELRQHVGVESGQAVAAERGQHDRLVRRHLQHLADLFARPRRVPGDERDVLDVREALEPADIGSRSAIDALAYAPRIAGSSDGASRTRG